MSQESVKPRKRRSTGKPTLADVAKLAGVGHMTASRVVKNPNQVSPELRERVNEAIKTLGYVPNFAAGALASSQSNLVICFYPITASSFESQLLNLLLAKGIEGKRLTFCPVPPNWLSIQPKIDNLLLNQPDHCLLIGNQFSSDFKAYFAQYSTLELLTPASVISKNYFQLGQMAAQYLFEQGYTAPTIAIAQMHENHQALLSGWQDQLRSLGCAEHRVLTSRKPPSYAVGAELLAQSCTNFPESDAIFFSDDLLAVGAIFECQRRYIRLPQELGLLGVGDTEICRVIFPELSSIALETSEVIETLNTTLNASQDEPVKYLIPFQLNERSSTIP